MWWGVYPSTAAGRQFGTGEHRIKVKEIAEADMYKLSVRWVPRLLTLDQKRIRINVSKALLDFCGDLSCLLLKTAAIFMLRSETFQTTFRRTQSRKKNFLKFDVD